MLLAFIAVTAVLGSSRLRGFISLALGLTIGLVGLDSVSGQARLTFGIPQLGDGIDIVVVAVGIFALGEALWVAAHLRRRAVEVIRWAVPGWASQTSRDRGNLGCEGPPSASPSAQYPPAEPKFRPSCPISPRSGSPSIRRSSAKGAIEGVAGPEAANNASAAGTMVPMLSLGLPTNATAAVMLAALVSYGSSPDPAAAAGR